MSVTDEHNFDPSSFDIVPARTFEQLELGEVFRAPSRTVTEAHASAFQAVSADNHPVHYDTEWARAHGHTARRKVTPLQQRPCRSDPQ